MLFCTTAYKWKCSLSHLSIKRNFRETTQILKKGGVGSVGVTGVIEMKWQRKTLQNQRKSSFFFFPVFLSILSNEVKGFFVCNDTILQILFVKLRGAIPTLITSWGTHELVSLSLEMELWQRPPITAINVLKFCSWWSFCIDIQENQYLLFKGSSCSICTSKFYIFSIVFLWSFTSFVPLSIWLHSFR